MDHVDFGTLPTECERCGQKLRSRWSSPAESPVLHLACEVHGLRARLHPFNGQSVAEYGAAGARRALYDDVYDPATMGGLQGPVREVFDYLDEWAGERFGLEFADRMGGAPSGQLHNLMDGWPAANGLLDRPRSLDPLDRLQLRPSLSGWQGTDIMLATAVQLLFYVDQVVVESDVVDPFMDLKNRAEVSGRSIQTPLRRLAHLRPLIEDGSIKFAGRWRGTYPSHLAGFFEVMESVPQGMWATETPEERFTSSTLIASQVAGSLLLVEESKAHALAQTRNEEIAYRALFENHDVDGRTSHLDTLSRLDVPALTGEIDQLIRIRNDSEAFGEWRAQLAVALSAVSGVPDGPTARDEAREIVSDALLMGMRKFEREARASPALEAAKGGLKRLTFNAVGTVAGTGMALVTGNPLMGVVTGTALGVGTNAATSVGDYLRLRRLQKRSRALLDIAMSFRRAID